MLHNKRPSSADQLLKWYDKNRRQMPWRALPGVVVNPYYVWLSEIMLQQTTVATVKAYFEKFIEFWPTINDLAQASEDEVLTAWAGLGYYSRARNLYKCAQIIVDQYQGVFPQDIKSLKELPGIGDYTANAIRSIAFGREATVVDGNVERVISRVFQIEIPLPRAKKIIKEHAKDLSPKKRPDDYSQAIMDLGATVCTPKKPKCSVCPWLKKCIAFATQSQEKYPIKLPKKTRPKKATVAFIFLDDEARIFLRRRENKGLLAGMMEVPSTDWVVGDVVSSDASFLKKKTTYEVLPDSVHHVFTHFELTVQVVILKSCDLNKVKGVWVKREDLDNYALPTLMKKIITHGYTSFGDSGVQEEKAVVKQ